MQSSAAKTEAQPTTTPASPAAQGNEAYRKAAGQAWNQRVEAEKSAETSQQAPFTDFPDADGYTSSEKPTAEAKDNTLDPNAGMYADHAPKDAAETEDADAEDAEAEGAETEDADAAEETEEATEERPKSRSKPLKQRLKQETRRRGDAERALDAARAENQQLAERLARIEGSLGLKEPAKPAAADKDAAPDASKYTYGDVDPRYIADVAAHAARGAIKTAMEEQRKEALAAQAEKDYNTQLTAAVKRGSEKYEDFHDVVVEGAERGDWALSAEMAQLVVGSDLGHEIAYFLAKNPKEADRIAALPVEQQYVAFGRLEARFSAPPVSAKTEQKAQAPVSKAPAPVRQPRNAGGQFAINGATDDFGALWSHWRGRNQGH